MATMTTSKVSGTSYAGQKTPSGLRVSSSDRITPAIGLTTTEADGSVQLRQPETHRDQPPVSVPTLLRRAVDAKPDKLALAVKRNDVWQKWTYAEYYSEARIVAKAFIALGLEQFHSVGILGFNAPEWFISQVGAIMAGGFAVGMYTTNSPIACKYIASDSRANIIVVEDEKELRKIEVIRSELPHLKAIIQYTGSPSPSSGDGVIGWEQLLELGRREDDRALTARLERVAVNQCCTLIYTSGTTGAPKGVMMSHDNLTWTAMRANEYSEVTAEEVVVSYLPLSHSAAQMVDVWMPMAAGAAVYFADKNALKGSLGQTLREVRPTFLFGVPRVFEKIQEKMQQLGKSSGGVRRAVATWAKNAGLKHNLKAIEASAAGNPEAKTPSGYAYPIAKKLVFNRVKEALGLDRARLLGIGAAPMARETFEYFLSLDMPLYEVYGMSECSGPQTSNRPGQHRLGSVGPTLTGFQTRIADAADADDPEGNGGEILISSRNVMMGYLFSPEKTSDAIDEDGWLHSGDIGRQDKDGYFKITGRIKELIITAGGENVAPVPIEDRLKAELPCLSNAMVIGDKRKFLAVLLTLRAEVDADSLQPKAELTEAAVEWAMAAGSRATTTEEAMVDKHVSKAIKEGIDRYNTKYAVSNAQKVQKFTILNRDFSVPGGELGPTLKLKRHYVLKKYNGQITNLYNF